MKKRYSVGILALILVFALATTSLAATGYIDLHDVNGKFIESIKVHRHNAQLVNVRDELSRNGYNNSYIWVESDQLSLEDDRTNRVDARLDYRGFNEPRPWKDNFYPFDYMNYQVWDDAWHNYVYPSFGDYARYWNYDANAYARYVAHYDDLKNHSEEELRSGWYKEGKVSTTAVYHKYIVGVEGSAFEPDRALTRAEAAMMFARLLAGDESFEGQPVGYEDVNETDWYKDAIGYTMGKGLVIAEPTTEFRPNDPINAADFNLMLVKAAQVLGLDMNVESTSGDQVSRREAVRLINGATGRVPDVDYITQNIASPFTDVAANQRGYDELMTACVSYIEVQWKDGLVGWSTHLQ